MSDRDPIDALVDDVHASLSRARAAVPPDFAGVLARTRDFFDPPAAAASDDSYRPVVDIRTRARAGADGLDNLVADARVSLERMIESARMRAIPPLPRVMPLRRPSAPWRRPVALLAGVASLAAAAVFAFAMVRWSAHAERSDPGTRLDQAFRVPVDGANDAIAIEKEDAAAKPRRPVARVAEPSSPGASIASTPPPSIVVPAVRTAPRRVDGDRLRALSDEARALWRAGDLAGAEVKFLEVTASGGRKALAELAWGDLFALANQHRDTARLAKRWRAYLGKFPRGRYADDARAGLCRASASPGTCWPTYLRDFPRGSYRAEAEALPRGARSP